MYEYMREVYCSLSHEEYILEKINRNHIIKKRSDYFLKKNLLKKNLTYYSLYIIVKNIHIYLKYIVFLNIRPDIFHLLLCNALEYSW